MRKLRAYLLAGTILSGMATAPARAELITLSLLAATGIEWGLSAAAVSTLTSFLTAAVGIGASYLISALTPKPAGAGSMSGTTFETTFGSTAPRSAIFGQQKTGGHRVHVNVYGSKNKHLQVVEAIGDGLHDSLTGIIYNGKRCELVPLTGGENDGGAPGFLEDGGVPYTGGVADQEFRLEEFTRNGTPYVTVRFWRGHADQLADPELVAQANPPEIWTSAARGAGVCYCSITQLYDEDLQLTGPPSVQYIVKGLRLYDPRKDSTNGVGSGSHRWGVESTYEWSDNPAVIEYNIRRGVFVGSQQLLGMRNVLATDLLLPMYVTAANICDEDVDDVNGDPEKRYACGFRASDDREVSESIRTVAASMAGWCLDRYGQFGPIAGAAQVPVRSFSERDMIFDTGFTFNKYRSRSSLVTAVFGRFTDGSKDWDEDSFPPRINPADDALIGERIARDLDLTPISSTSRAQRIAETFKRRTLLQKNGSCVLRPEFIEVDPGEWLTFQSESEGTFNVIVLEAGLNPDGTIPITFEEIGASVYGDPDGVTASSPVVDNGGPVLTPTLSGFTVTPVSLPSDNPDIYRPGADVAWTPVYDPSVRQIVVEYRKAGDTTSPTMRQIFDTPGIGSGRIAAGLQSETEYEFQATLVTDPIRTTTPTTWHALTTTAQAVPAGPVGWGTLVAPLQKQITDTLTAFSRVEKMIQDVASAATEVDAHAFLSFREMRGELSAAVEQLVGVNLTQDMASATFQTSVTASFVAQYALINTNATAIATANGSIATLTTLVGATAGDGLRAAVSTNTSAIATTNSALSSLQTIVGATAGDGLRASVTINATAIATLNGTVGSLYTVKLGAGNVVGGWYAVNDGSTVAMKFDTDIFTIGRTGANLGGTSDFVQLFTVTTINGLPALLFNGTAYIQSVVASSIDTVHLRVDSVDITRILLGSTSGSVSATHNAATVSVPTTPTGVGVAREVTLCSAVLNVKSGAADFQYSTLYLRGTATVDGSFFLKLYCDTTLVGLWEYKSRFTSGSNKIAEFVGTVRWNVPGLSAGNHTFYVKASAESGAGNWVNSLDSSGGQMFVSEFRR